MKRVEVKSNVLANVKNKIPYSAELAEAADTLTDNTVTDVNEKKIGDIEAIGRLSMATLVKGTANGGISMKEAFPLLKGLAEKKTPDPVQRIEAHQTIDMRAILTAAIIENPHALQSAADKAVKARETVRQRIGAVDDALELKSLPSRQTLQGQTATASDDDATSALDVDIQSPLSAPGLESYSLTKTEWTPGQSPKEIVGLTKS